jgi:RNA polymerase sigma factor (sigma-70 family)
VTAGGFDAPMMRVKLFEERVIPHLSDLYRAAHRLLGPGVEVDDVVQEVCLRAFRGIEQISSPEASRAWVFAILRSVFLQRVARQRLPLAQLEEADDVSADRTVSRWDELDDASPLRQAMLVEVRQAVLGLPPTYREALVLAHVGGFSYREMADILDIPIGTVMSRLFRARRLVRVALGEAPMCRRDSERSQ